VARPLSRRERVSLLVMIGVAVVASVLLQFNAPIGQDVGDSGAALQIVSARGGPGHDVKGADLTVVVFTDYQCPACKLAHPAMERAVKADGRVRLLYKDWPIFGPLSEQAARIAIAAHFQGLYPAVHDRLMRERRALSRPVLRQAVLASGGDWKRIEHDLASRAPEIDLILARNQMDASRLNIAGTPAYLAGPYLVVGALSESQFRRAFANGRRAQKRWRSAT